MPSSSFYRNVNRFSILVFAASKTAYPIHFVKKISSAAKIRKSVNPQLLTLFFAGKMALLSKYCRDETDKTPQKNSGQNFKVDNCITVRFGKMK
jgi:hypothetical protein